jgi:hypothetical protein
MFEESARMQRHATVSTNDVRIEQHYPCAGIASVYSVFQDGNVGTLDRLPATEEYHG